MRRFRSKRRKPELNAQINVTNLVDVTLVILIVFMLIAPLIEHSIPVNLPKAEEKKISDPTPITIVIARDKKLYVNSVQVTLEELAGKLEENPQIPVNVQGDAAIAYQEFVDVISAIQKAGVTRIGLATEVRVSE